MKPSARALTNPLDNRRKALKLATTFQFERITCPGVYLNNRADDVFLIISVLNKKYKSPSLTGSFPMLIHEQFHIEKVFKNCSDPFELGKHLKNENVVISLIQNFQPLAEVSVNLKDFLYTKTHKAGSNLIRELLLNKTDLFPGTLAPKLEFISQSSIREVIAKPKKSQIYNNLFPEPTSPQAVVLNEEKRNSRRQDRTSGKLRSGDPPASAFLASSTIPRKQVSAASRTIIGRRPRPKTASGASTSKRADEGGPKREKVQQVRARSPMRLAKKEIAKNKIIQVNKSSSDSGEKLFNFGSNLNSNSEEHLPNYMRKTVSSRSKSPPRKPHKVTRAARHVLNGVPIKNGEFDNGLIGYYSKILDGKGDFDEFTKTVKIRETSKSSKNKSSFNNVPGIKSKKYSNAIGRGDFGSSRDTRTGLLTADNVERLLESNAARKIYQDALENARLQEQLNNIRVDFNEKGNSYWTSHNAFSSGKSHRQVFNGLLDDAYTSFYETLNSES